MKHGYFPLSTFMVVQLSMGIKKLRIVLDPLLSWAKKIICLVLPHSPLFNVSLVLICYYRDYLITLIRGSSYQFRIFLMFFFTGFTIELDCREEQAISNLSVGLGHFDSNESQRLKFSSEISEKWKISAR